MTIQTSAVFKVNFNNTFDRNVSWYAHIYHLIYNITLAQHIPHIYITNKYNTNTHSFFNLRRSDFHVWCLLLSIKLGKIIQIILFKPQIDFLSLNYEIVSNKNMETTVTKIQMIKKNLTYNNMLS